jgi:hypothetical protein
MTTHDCTTRKQTRLDRVDVLVIDYLEELHELYLMKAPQEHTFLCVPDVTSARAMLHRLPNLGVIVIQGRSMYDHENPLSLSPGNTVHFIRDAVEAGFRGQFVVVSTMFDDQMRRRFPIEAPWRTTLADKEDFWDNPAAFLTDDLFVPFPARDELWAEWELRLDPALHPKQPSLPAQYVERVLSWLERMDAALMAGDLHTLENIANVIAPVLSDDMFDGTCDCDCPADEVCLLSWWHAIYHRLVNRAIWEMVQAVPGLAACLRARFQRELDAAPEYWHDNPEVLEMIQHRNPLALEFLRPGGPGPQWFDTLSASTEA